MDRSSPQQSPMSRMIILGLVVAVHAIVLLGISRRSSPSSDLRIEGPPARSVLVIIPVPSTPAGNPPPGDRVARAIPAIRRKPPPAEPPAAQPSTIAPAPRAAIDWRNEAVVSAQSMVESTVNRPHTRSFDVRDLPSMAAPRASSPSDFPWDPLHARRFTKLPDGPFVLRVSDNCMIVITVTLIPTCKIGKLPARGDLFQHMGEDEVDHGPDGAAKVVMDPH